jgi:hypothetical protein
MKPQVINLEDLVPQASSFKLTQFPKMTFKLPPCTGGKVIEMSKKIGNVEKLLSMPNAENIAKLAMMLMDFESASLFKKQVIKTIDAMTGEEDQKEVGGYHLLALAMRGMNEQYDIYRAILEAMGYGKERSAKIVKDLKVGIQKIVDGEMNRDTKKKTKKKKKS